MALSTGTKVAVIMRKTRLNFADKEKNHETVESAMAEVRAETPEYFEGVTDEDIAKAFKDFRKTLG